MSSVAAVASSALVAAVVSGAISYLSQRRLLDRKALVDYEFAARKRLYEVIGPLRFEFLLAARDLESRVLGHPPDRWNMDPTGYYVSTFIYRILRPFAVGDLIERQLAVADFSVDPTAIELLRLLKAMERTICGDEILLDHPGADWATESQHLFRQNLRAAAGLLVVEDDDGGGRKAVMPFGAFRDAYPDPMREPQLRSLAAIFGGCRENLQERPIFWLRLVGYGAVCAHLVRSQGVALGFDDRPYSVPELLSGLDDEHITGRVGEHATAVEAMMRRGL